VTEDELLTAITSGTKKRPGLCKLLGVRYYHPYDSRRTVPGFPDLVLSAVMGWHSESLNPKRERCGQSNGNGGTRFARSVTTGEYGSRPISIPGA
jgi:hypothetical protein